MAVVDGGRVRPYDAVLLVSFGGPEGPDDVLPFLRNVTAGRGVPDDRLTEVASHYQRFGGRSPINAQNRALLAAVRADLRAHGIDVPVYWGNRNWAPYLADTVQQMTVDGVRRAACFVTSAYSSYSGCRQYRENLFDAVQQVQATAGSPPQLDKLRHYFDHPGFLGAVVDGVVAALERLPAAHRDEARLVFVTHSIPVDMDKASGRHADQPGGAYTRQHADVAATVGAQVGVRTGQDLAYELVYCSRSGPPHVAWLEPDVNDQLAALAQQGVQAVVLVPIGFVSDHMEVVFDLDTEARDTAERLGLVVARSATPGTHPDFVAMVRDLLVERAVTERGGLPTRRVDGRLGPSWDVCPVGCCANPRGQRPAAAGEDTPE